MQSLQAIRNGRLRAELLEAEARYVQRNPRSREQAIAAAEVMPGGNTRSSLWFDPFPLTIAGGESCRIRDLDGHGYTNLLGEFTSGIYGHSPHAIKAALSKALDGGISLSGQTCVEAQLAAAICQRFPSVDLIRFANSGTEANINAIAAAMAYTGRRTILVFEGGFHGGVLAFHPGGSRTNIPHDYVIGRFNDTEHTAALVRAHADSLAAVLVEPMQGANGCIPATEEFLRVLRREATEAGSVLIFDEIQTARLSYGGAQQVFGVIPDMTTIGKFFGGGLAFGAFGGRRPIMELYDPRRPDALAHPGTFNNNALTMAAGLAATESLLTAANLERLNAVGEDLRQRIAATFERRRAPFRISGMGSLMNIHPTSSAEDSAGLRKLLFLDLLESGFYIAARGLIALSFEIQQNTVDQFVGTLSDLLDARKPMLDSLALSASS